MPAATICPSAEKWARISEWSLVGSDAEDFARHLEKCVGCANRVESLAKQHYVAGLLQAETVDQAMDEAHLNTVISRLARLGDPWATVTDANNKLPDGSSWSVKPGAVESKHSAKVDTRVPGDIGSRAAPEFQSLGGYRLIREIGRGGMGVVYEAYDEALKRPVVVKVVGPSWSDDENARKRFVREGRMLAAVESDHIVTIYHVGEDQGILYLAMPLLEGANLENWLKARSEPITAAEILWVARDVLTGLAELHAKKIVHRDIKPKNLWVEKKTGRVKILDFGLSRLIAGSTVTPPSAVVGTPAYMSPEQATGAPVDSRSDLFSLGATLYRMARGSSPFERGTTTETLAAIVNFEPFTLTGLPPEVSDFVGRLMSKDPNDRFKDAGAALAEVKAIEGNLKDATTVTFERPKPTRQRNRKLIAAALVGLAVVVIATVIIIIDRNGRRIEVKVPDAVAIEVIGQDGKKKTVWVDPKTKKEVKPSVEAPQSTEIEVGSIVAVTAEQTRGFADNTSDAEHDIEKLKFLGKGIRGEVKAIANNRCLILVDDPPGEEVWVSLEVVERRK